MRITISALVVLVIATTNARAQPGADPVEPSPYGQPPPYVPPPSGYQPTAEEQELLAVGEISDDQHAGGALAAAFLGFGTGQLIQGRWHDTGWIFTLGETASLTALVTGMGMQISDCWNADGAGQPCTSNHGMGLLVGGLIGFVGFRIWGTVDALVMPPRHNAQLRALRARLGDAPPMYSRLAPYVVPVQGGGSVAGLTLRF